MEVCIYRQLDAGFQIEVDVAGQQDGQGNALNNCIPTYDDLLKYKIETMKVITDGPGGGNPNLVLVFPDRRWAAAFLTNWYHADIDFAEWVGKSEGLI